MEHEAYDSKPPSLIYQYLTGQISPEQFMERAEAEERFSRRAEKRAREIGNRIIAGYGVTVGGSAITLAGVLLDNPYVVGGAVVPTVLGSTLMIRQSPGAAQQMKRYVPRWAGRKNQT